MSQVIEPQLDRTTYYSILGLTSNATSSEVHKSYLKLARLLHPDKTKTVIFSRPRQRNHKGLVPHLVNQKLIIGKINLMSNSPTVSV